MRTEYATEKDYMRALARQNTPGCADYIRSEARVTWQLWKRGGLVPAEVASEFYHWYDPSPACLNGALHYYFAAKEAEDPWASASLLDLHARAWGSAIAGAEGVLGLVEAIDDIPLAHASVDQRLAGWTFEQAADSPLLPRWVTLLRKAYTASPHLL